MTEGSGASDKSRLEWVPQLAPRMGWTNYRVDALGLTGFLRPGGNGSVDRTYGNRVRQFHERSPGFEPDLVVFQGGFKDSIDGSSELAVAVRDTIENARRIWPSSQFIVIGPITSCPALDRIAQAYQRGALLANTPAIDMNRKPAFDIKDAEIYLTEDEMASERRRLFPGRRNAIDLNSWPGAV
ncbi:SGNH/GDSL hydrolase family protein [Rhodococcus sp. Rp3]|nr:SGNH/GDSL hydrolase family protein [Rhodococcus sp. Rp3]